MASPHHDICGYGYDYHAQADAFLHHAALGQFWPTTAPDRPLPEPPKDNTAAVRAWPEPESREQSLAEQPLELLCEHSDAGPDAWQPLVWDEARRCFAFHWPCALSSSVTDKFLARLRDTAPWQPIMDKSKTKVARQTAWYTRNKACNCAYTYGDDVRVDAPQHEEFRNVMEDLVHCVFKKFPSLPPEAWPNCANLNLYTDGEEGVGWHADDEVIFMGTARDCPILSVSLGGMREFWLSLQSEGSPDVRPGVVEIDLRDGDLLSMEGLMQKHCMHCVPRSNSLDVHRQQLRINITFRWMRLHREQCPYARVAKTWCMLAQSMEQPSPSATESREAGSMKNMPEHPHHDPNLKILDPVTQKPITSSKLSKTSKRASKHERTLVMSPLPLTARALFGEGSRQFDRKLCGPNGANAAILGWNPGSNPMGAVKWQACDACGHTCWAGGRACQEDTYSGQWFCRCCWWGWTVAEREGASYHQVDWHCTQPCGVGGEFYYGWVA